MLADPEANLLVQGDKFALIELIDKLLTDLLQ
jgi:hypothetical protein